MRNDAVAAILWSSINLGLGAAAWRVAARYFPDDPSPRRLVHALVAALAVIVGTGTALGAVGLLYPPAFLAVVALAAVGLDRLRPGGASAPAPDPSPAPGPPVWTFVWGAWWLLVVAMDLSWGLNFPVDFDALMYHVPMVDHWLQAHSLYAPDAYYWFFPGNAELVSLWIVGPFSGDFLVGLTNLPALALLAASAFQLATTLGLRRPLSHIVALAVASHRVIVLQVFGIGNDLPAIALFVTALQYGFRLTETPTRPLAVLLAASVGLLAGVKYYALGYAGLVGVVMVLMTLDRRGVRAACAVAAVLVLGSILLGGYWYARNAAMAGSPLYPKSLTGVNDVATRKYPEIAQSSIWGNPSPELLRLTSEGMYRMAGPLLWLSAASAPVTLPWLFVTGLRGRRPPKRARPALAAAFAGSAILLLITPFSVEDDPGTLNGAIWGYHPARYGLCFLTLALFALALVVQDAFDAARPGSEPGWSRWGPFVLLMGLFGWQLSQMPGELSSRLPTPGGLAVTTGAAAAWLVATSSGSRGRRLASAALAIAAVAGTSIGATALADRWHAGFARNYDATFSTDVFSSLERAGPGAIRVCVHDYRGYPFFGSRRQSSICQPYYVPRPEWLVRYLRDRRATHISVRRDPRVEDPVRGADFWSFDKCLASHPAAFTDPRPALTFTLFTVDPAGLEDVASPAPAR